MSIYVPHSVRLAGGTAVSIASVSQLSLPRNVELTQEVTAGTPFARFIATRSLRPMVSFTTFNVAQALGLTGSTALSVKTGNTYTALEVFYALLDDCGRFAAGNVHLKIAFAKGCLVPRVLSGSAGQDVSLTMEFMALGADDITSPATVSGTQALPALGTEERYALGPLKIEDIDITELDQLSVDFGNTVTQHVFGTGLYPTHVSVDSQLPVINFTSKKANLYTTSIPDAGLDVTNDLTDIWFRQRRQAQDALWADTEERHLLLNASGHAVIDDPFSASGSAPGTITGRVACYFDGTNAPVTITANQAIEVA